MSADRPKAPRPVDVGAFRIFDLAEDLGPKAESLRAGQIIATMVVWVDNDEKDGLTLSVGMRRATRQAFVEPAPLHAKLAAVRSNVEVLLLMRSTLDRQLEEHEDELRALVGHVKNDPGTIQ